MYDEQEMYEVICNLLEFCQQQSDINANYVTIFKKINNYNLELDRRITIVKKEIEMLLLTAKKEGLH